MKITRIQRIKEHRIFRDFTWPAQGLHEFSRFNVIYGWNGAGKTTLSELFRHLERRVPITEGNVQFAVDGHSIEGRSLDTAALPNVRVFNRNSGNLAVFESPNKQLPPIFVLGEESVEKQKQIEQLKQQAEQNRHNALAVNEERERAKTSLETFCEEQARAIKNLLTAPGSSYNNYNKATFKKAIHDLRTMAQLPQTLSPERKSQYLAVKAGEPKPRLAPLALPYPDVGQLTSDVQAMLSRSVFSAAIAELVDDPAVGAWVGQGLSLHLREGAGDTCLFCESPLPQKRLSRLQAHFNDEFERFQRDVEVLLQRVVAAKEAATTPRLPDASLLYPHLAEAYRKHSLKLGQQTIVLGRYLDALRVALLAKKDSPFKPLDILPFLTNAESADEPAGILETLFQVAFAGTAAIGSVIGQHALTDLNAIIAEHNAYTDDFSKQVEEARGALERDAVLSVLKDYTDCEQAVTAAKERAEAFDDELDKLNAEIDRLKLAIRNHQRPVEELNAEMAAYLGRDELRFEVRGNGYVITRNGHPAMHLSEGERTAVALMYFLKTLSDENFNIQRDIIVIDDPVSSLDANSLYSAFAYIRGRLPKPDRYNGQLFILTHNFTFFRLVKNWFNQIRKLGVLKSDPAKLRYVRFYMLKGTSLDGRRAAEIGKLDDLLHRYESEYHYLFRKVYEYAHKEKGGGLEEYYSLPNICRRLLEAVLSFKQPQNADGLYQQINAVEGFDAAAKARIQRFLDTYSHNNAVSEPEHDLSILAETPAVLRCVLELIHHLDAQHHDNMVALIGMDPEGEPQANAAPPPSAHDARKQNKTAAPQGIGRADAGGVPGAA